MAKFYTSRITYIGTGRIPIVAKENHSFSPLWVMVDDYKSGRITWEEYRERYLTLLRAEYRKNPKAFDIQDGSVFCCFCVPTEHCHRFILAECLQKLGHEYGGEI